MRALFLLSVALLLSPGIFAQDFDSLLSSVKYRNIGPFRGGRSVSASGVVGDPLTYYMGTTGGGLWKTEDAGQTWKNISDGYFKTGSVGAVAVSESDPNVVYCGMGEHAPRGVMTSYGDGVYKSTDGGKTWIDDSPTPGITVLDLQSIGDRIYAVGSSGKMVVKKLE